MKLKIPDIAQGKVSPYSVQKSVAKDEHKRKDNQKQIYVNVLINVGCTILGAILSNLTEIFNWISALLNQQ